MDVKKLTDLRKRLGFSQAQMAKELHVSRSYYNQVEGGKEPVSPKVAERVEVLESEHLVLRDVAPSGQSRRSPYSHFTIETLQKSIGDLSAKLPTLPESEHKYVLGDIREILDELEQRELLKKAVEGVKEPGVVYGRASASSKRAVDRQVKKAVRETLPKPAAK